MHARLDKDSISTQPMAKGATADSISEPGSRQSNGVNYQRGVLAAMLRQLRIDQREF